VSAYQVSGLSLGFWSGRTSKNAWLLSTSLFACLLANLAAAVAINQWNKYFFDALQTKNQQIIL
jgi:putative ATP-binding cassette transporter